MAMTGVLVDDSHAGTVTRSFDAPLAKYSDHCATTTNGFCAAYGILAMLHFEMGAKQSRSCPSATCTSRTASTTSTQDRAQHNGREAPSSCSRCI